MPKKLKKDDPEQSERFVKTAQDVDVVDDEKAFERVIKAVAEKPKKSKPSVPKTV